MKLTVLDIGGTFIKYAKYRDGELYDFSECDTQAKKGGAHVMKRAMEIIRSMGSCDGIGISTAGQVSEDGSIQYANDNLPGYTGMEVRRLFEETFAVPVTVENDVNAAAVGEGHFGAAKGKQDYLCLTYGTGIGGAIVINGEVFRGIGGAAGEFGSMVVHGREVRPGERMSGCYENYASTAALVRRVQEKVPWITDGRKVLHNLETREVREIVEDWIREIAYGLVTLIHIFNPQCVILGGGVMNQDCLTEALTKNVKAQLMPGFQEVEILKASLGNKAGLWGIAYLAEQKR